MADGGVAIVVVSLAIGELSSPYVNIHRGAGLRLDNFICFVLIGTSETTTFNYFPPFSLIYFLLGDVLSLIYISTRTR